MQGVPAEQATPHVPQFAWLVVRSTHSVPHALVPVGHATTQCPPTHDWPTEQAAPHAPQ
jgi:hypothetical protein